MLESDQKPVRSIPQNSAMYKFFNMLSDSLNNAGLDVLTVLNEKVEIEWTSELVKEFSEELAIILNGSGLTLRVALDKGNKVRWTWERVKILIWRKVQILQFGIKSTAKLNIEQVSRIYELINRHIAKFGVSVIFPSKER